MGTRKLVIGRGAREAALAWRLAHEGDTVWRLPENTGISNSAPRIDENDFERIFDFVIRNHIDLTICGPEGPLCNGIRDYFDRRGKLLCGPTREAALITEGWKPHLYALLARHNIPTPVFRTFEYDEFVASGESYIESRGGATSIVAKLAGICGGKGAVLPETFGGLLGEISKLKQTYPDAARQIVVQDRIYGTECSMSAATNGTETIFLPTTRDYKRRFDGDKGPNTGGMGAHTCELSPTDFEVCADITKRIVCALKKEGAPYQGFLYPGFMLTKDGPVVLEVNCRLGDPETQAIVCAMGGDLGSICLNAVNPKGAFKTLPYPDKVREAVCVVATSREYPEKTSFDGVLLGFEEAAKHARIFHASTKRTGTVLTAGGGRIASFVGIGTVLKEARENAYRGARIAIERTPRLDCRSDIGN